MLPRRNRIRTARLSRLAIEIMSVSLKEKCPYRQECGWPSPTISKGFSSLYSLSLSVEAAHRQPLTGKNVSNGWHRVKVQ